MKRLRSTLFVSYVAIIAICVLTVAIYAGVSLRNDFFERLSLDLRIRAELIRQRFLLIPDDERARECDLICKELGEIAQARVTVMTLDGSVCGDSLGEPDVMDNHGSRPEVVGALESSYGENVRFSKTLRKRMFYVAIPAPSADQPEAIVRLAVPEDEVTNQLWGIYAALGVGALAAIVIALLVGGLISRAILRPLNELGSAAKKLGEGELSVRVMASSDDEIGMLCKVFNEMANNLELSIQELAAERNEREAILRSMKEGIVTIHNAGKVLVANEAFKELIGAEGQDIKGRPLIETVREVSLIQFVNEANSTMEPTEKEVAIHNGQNRLLSLHAVPFIGSDGERIGTLIVTRDVTRIRRLEEVRRSFVANVSHELKTPITLIKGYIETLLDGAMKDSKRLPEFLNKVVEHTNRMNSIIDDLLQLAALEAGQDEIKKTTIDLASAAKSVKTSFSDIAAGKGIAIQFKGPEDHIYIRANESLLEHAIANLIDNAVKYTNKGGSVDIEVRVNGATALLDVRDDGIGIERRHQDRIFERFYRVDEARSRRLGGTGLGLSIVKHIVSSLGGRVSFVSQPGEGSTFTIELPME
ncbi:MAG: HAMP domain-containing protein [Candidatus Coatesbacteria bacterium]|nr:HAMP domain-containing protein [Candidatus Coatesbacteria bacterium]